MKKFFEKNEIIICMFLIVFYILVNSYCIQNFGMYDIRNAIVNTLFSLFLLFLIIKINRLSYYGFKKPKNLKRYLYFIPLVFIISVNLWPGINITNSAKQILFYIISMINVGFIEEVIFRGFLFKMMEKDNLKLAIIVSSLTFGIGHFINLLNGAPFISTLLQVFYSISIGFLFVIIFYKSKSLIPCIITHSLVNALSVFYIENNIIMYLSSVFLVIVPILYSYYIIRYIK